MSVRPVDAQRSFYHTDYLAGNLFGSVNRYRLFREKIWPKLLELGPKLDAVYCAENGRPPIDAVLLCGVTAAQQAVAAVVVLAYARNHAAERR